MKKVNLRTGCILLLISVFSIAKAQDDPFIRLQKLVANQPVQKVNMPQKINVSTNDPNYKVNKRAPIPYVPLPLVDAQGKLVSSTTMITLPNGKHVIAGTYYADLNQLEKSLNADGYTLRSGKDIPVSYMQTDSRFLDEKVKTFSASVAPRLKGADLTNFMSSKNKFQMINGNPVPLPPDGGANPGPITGFMKPAIYKSSNNNQLYYVFSKMVSQNRKLTYVYEKRAIPNDNYVTLGIIGFTKNEIETTSNGSIAEYSDGWLQNMKSGDPVHSMTQGMLVKDTDQKYYQIKNSLLYYIPDLQTLQSLGLNTANAVLLQAEDINLIRSGYRFPSVVPSPGIVIEKINEDAPYNWTLGDPSVISATLKVDLNRQATIYSTNTIDSLQNLSEMKINASADLSGSLFGNSADIFSAGAVADAPADLTKKRTMSVSASVLSQSIANKTESVTGNDSLTWSDPVYARSVDYSYPYTVPICGPITFSGKIGIKGSVGLDVGASLVMGMTSRVEASAKPVVSLQAYGEAEVGIGTSDFGAGVGVDANLTFVTADLDFNTSFSIGNLYQKRMFQYPFTYTYNLGYDLQFLKGDLSVFAQACFFHCFKVSHTIFSWPGYVTSGTLCQGSYAHVFTD